MRKIALLLATLLPATISARAADQWVKLTTPHFQLYTDAGEKKGREAILYFEQVRQFFLDTSPLKKVPDEAVRIVAFRSEKQFRPYSINEFASAFYTHDENRDYIIMGDIVPEHYPAAIHEYTHLIIAHSGLHVPVWMNEGWADLYSTLKPKGDKAIVGELIPGRVQTLIQNRWIPLSEISRVDFQSSLYNERDKAGVFYAESWAFMHMLYLAPDYSKKFSSFVLAISSGKTMEQACEQALGKPVEQVEQDLRQYFQRSQLFAAVFNVKLTKSEEEPVVSAASDFESGLVLADILAVSNKTERASEAYAKLIAMKPDDPALNESLGYLAWHSGKLDDTRKYFAKAMENGSTDALMCYRLGLLSHGRGDNEVLTVRALRRALELKPDYTDARLHLGMALLTSQDYEGVLRELKELHKVSDAQAPAYFSTTAVAHAHLGQLDDARKDAQQAKRWAKSPEEVSRAERLLKSFENQQKPELARESTGNGESDGKPTLKRHDSGEAHSIAQQPGRPKSSFIRPGDKMAHVEGTAINVVCAGTAMTLTIEAGGKKLTFVIPAPEQILVSHGDKSTADLSCGPQKPFKVAIDYAMPRDAEKDADGIVRMLSF